MAGAEARRYKVFSTAPVGAIIDRPPTAQIRKTNAWTIEKQISDHHHERQIYNPPPHGAAERVRRRQYQTCFLTFSPMVILRLWLAF